MQRQQYLFHHFIQYHYITHHQLYYDIFKTKLIAFHFFHNIIESLDHFDLVLLFKDTHYFNSYISMSYVCFLLFSSQLKHKRESKSILFDYKYLTQNRQWAKQDETWAYDPQFFKIKLVPIF